MQVHLKLIMKDEPERGVKVMNDCMNGGGGSGAGDDERGPGRVG